MSRLPVSVKIVADELFTSWMETVARLNGCETETEMRAFCDTFFDGCRFTRLNNYPIHVSVLSDWMTILKKHTDLYMILPFLTRGIQGKIFEICLRNPNRTGAKFVGRGGVYAKYKICPICYQNDIKQYGRKVIHVPHQQSDTCWKHNVKLKYADDFELNDLEIEYGTEQEKQMAAFMHDSYENPVYISLEQTNVVFQKIIKERHLTVKQVCEELVKNGYLIRDNLPAEPTIAIYGKRKILLALLTWLFGNYTNFCKMLPKPTIFDSNGNEDFELLERIDVLGKYKCKTCAHIFYMHSEAARRGAPCPYCNLHMTDEEVCDRYLKNYFNNEYEIVDNNQLRHKICGTVRNVEFAFIFWKDVGYCSVCNSRTVKYQRKIDPTMTKYKVAFKGKDLEITHIPYQHSFTLSLCRLGHNSEDMYCRICDSLKNRRKRERECEENIDKAGQKRVIISYQGNQNVIAQYEDGKIYRMSYQSFSSGRVPFTRIHINHVGEKMINRQNEELEIVKYRTLQDLDVRYTDGTVVKHVKYEMFMRGTITREKRISKKDKCMGEENTNRWGEHMKIIDYRGYRDLDVQFDDGTIVTTTHVKFQRGTVKKQFQNG